MASGRKVKHTNFKFGVFQPQTQILDIVIIVCCVSDSQ